MRISDWSSDVCSSDLLRSQEHGSRALASAAFCRQHDARFAIRWRRGISYMHKSALLAVVPALLLALLVDAQTPTIATQNGRHALIVDGAPFLRSEEHTSELQSLMRISYAVFCLKKKKNKHGRDNSVDNYHNH